MNQESPYAPPKSDIRHLRTEVYRLKKYVIHEDGASWPFRCYKCNAPTRTRKPTKVYYLNPWWYLTLIVTPLVTIIFGLIFQKKFVIDLPICKTHQKMRRRYVTFQWVVAILSVLAFVIGAVTYDAVAWMSGFGLLLVVVLTALFGRQVYVSKFKSEYLWVRGAGREFIETLPLYAARK